MTSLPEPRLSLPPDNHVEAEYRSVPLEDLPSLLEGKDNTNSVSATTLRSIQSHWASRIFVAAWIGYAGFYFCRKNIAWTPLGRGDTSHALSGSLARLLIIFGIGYALGQFAGGSLADRYGSRRVLLAGGMLSALSTVALLSGLPVAALLGLQALNGFGQGFGWPSINRLLKAWIPGRERTIALAWWSSSYALGGFLATAVATALSTNSLFFPAATGARLSLLVPASILALTTGFFYLRVYDTPVDAAKSQNLKERHAIEPSSRAVLRESRLGYAPILRNNELRGLAAMYFFLKMTRYALLFWLPLYLLDAQHLTLQASVRIASTFELTGFIGALIAGYTADRILPGRRYAVGTTMLFLSGFILLLYPIAAMLGAGMMTVATGILGMLIFGADLLMSSAVVLDAVPLEQAGRASGFVNGVGSAGQIIAPICVTLCSRWFGWNSIFDFFVGSCILAGLLLIVRWDSRSLPVPA